MSMGKYDVVIWVKNVQADNEEEAKRRALDLIVSPLFTDVEIVARGRDECDNKD